MKINFWGAAQQVTGSSHYLEINGKKLLLDCGLFQGRRSDTYQFNREFCFPPGQVDAVVLSHAHIDHIGNLPNFVKHGFEGEVHAHAATVHLAELMLADSGHIQESDALFVNKKRAKKGLEPVEPLYTIADAQRATGNMHKHFYNTPFEVLPGVQVTFVEAGHILGSTAVVLDIEERGRKFRLWFSGDIGRPNLPILEDPVYPQQADYLIMECTYGDRPHDPPEKGHEELQAVVKQTLGRGGKVIIPAFAVGRTQELVYSIHRMMDAGGIPKVPVFVDSPLAVNVTDVFRAHPECFDEEARAMIESDKHRQALGFDMLTYIRDVEASKALNEREDPMIIISASGMMETGRILHHLRHNIQDNRSTLLIVSWMAPHTLGRRMLEGVEQVKIYGEVYKRKINVASVNGFSAHAGQRELTKYALGLKGQLKEIFLVHGEQAGADGLREKLAAEGMDGIHFPARGWSIEV
ncbi:MAG: MBL fold metallo-hydrolase [Anaerolineae bacterium]|nr:MBL fold metallo-hydrolase [Anaerolineae bacterium]